VNWLQPSTALPVPATSRTCDMARAAELPMTPPLVATATKIGTGSSHVGASTAASTRKTTVAVSWMVMNPRTSRSGSTRSTSRLEIQPAEISPTALTPKAMP